MTPYVFVIIGLVGLVLGAELLVRGASHIARIAGISPLVTGLTIVAYGTSAPELAVSVQAALSDQGGIALGNVVGSNIFNILLILGITAVISPLVINLRLIRFEVPFLILVSILAVLLSWDGNVDRWEGALLLTMAIIYTVVLVIQSRKADAQSHQTVVANDHNPTSSRAKAIGMAIFQITLGLIFLAGGSQLLVQGASSIARSLGVSELLIGLTIVSIGTSAPELVTSIVAAVRGERDMAAGNIIGSNLFNLLVVLGGSAAIASIPVAAAVLRFDLLVMTAVAIACLPIFFSGHRIDRLEGIVFIVYYIVYTGYIILVALTSEWSRTLSSAFYIFILPLTLLALFVSLLAHRQIFSKNKA